VGQFQEEIGGDRLVARIGELNHVTSVNARTLATGPRRFRRGEAQLQFWFFGCRNKGMSYRLLVGEVLN
jgi:hypothetical protein